MTGKEPSGSGATRVTTSNRAMPRISVGLAVYNGDDTIERCLDLILGQTFRDFEIVVSDNASDDSTPEILRRYAERDERVRVSRNPANIGQDPNMNRAFDLSRGELFRWISVDDWLEPRCLERCIAQLDAHPHAVGVTTGFRVYPDLGGVREERYEGEFPTSSDPARRWERMLWFFHAGDGKYDPIYGVYRREAMARTPRLRVSERSDWLIAAELALQGPIVHVPETLANRSRHYYEPVDRDAFRRKLRPQAPEEARATLMKFLPRARVARRRGRSRAYAATPLRPRGAAFPREGRRIARACLHGESKAPRVPSSGLRGAPVRR